MNRVPSQYARNLARLSARIFEEPIPSTERKAKYIVEYLSTEPYYKRRRFTHYYPPVQDTRNFFAVLRHLGLFVDEHKDFTEGIERQRELRGKGKKNRRSEKTA